MRRILERGRLEVFVSLGVPPFGFFDGTGEPAGFDVAIGRLLAEGLGVRPVFRNVPPSERIGRLRAGEGDVSANVAVSPEAARLVLLTSPVTRADIVLASAVRHVMRRPAELEGHAVGVLGGAGLEGSVAETLPAAARLLVYDSRAELAAACEQGLVEAVVLRRPVMTRFLTDYPRLGLTHRFTLTRRWMSVGVRFGEHDVLRALNSLIFLARTSGRLAALSDILLGTPQPDLPSF
ncbi:transporter substrate-binding domain-containing protein [Roseococcus sp. SDR]|uniref:transporter substrate-binding domain-containing protein n=1 Tax=Roseococcus sp. SDR TaxID=2835532 RepID=UPI001BCF8439|nr:transporter substrate-binding domain-containing protein [Roseococcus sp. SDR]MBS7789715.1 transporter substrate-binding domain-containing protein [Roseococcus sp. SDR]MBV1845029.1 transporter substrate-binding domain-containing protein [Roseococcus sp. SDR]